MTSHMIETGRIVESGEEGEGADSPKEFRDDGINRNIDMGFSISIPLLYTFEGKLDTLPLEVLLAICSSLDMGSLVRFAYVCRLFYKLARRTLLSLNLDRLLSVFVSLVSGFKRQLLLSGLVAYGWDGLVLSYIGD
jgi:hypothetical protein